MTHHLVANPRAARGRGGELVDVVRAEARRVGYDLHVLDADSPAATADVLRRAVDDGAERLVLVGGDGLVHLAVQATAGTDVTIGIVAAGTGNDFARSLDLPLDDPEAATRRALDEPVTLDALRCDDGWVASVAMVGFSVDVNARAETLRWPRGSGRYTVATLLELPTLATRELRLTIDGAEHVVAATILTVANTAYFGGGMAIAPSARPDDGLLEVTVIGDVGRIELLRVFPRVFKGSHVDHPAVTVLQATSVHIEGAGEHWGDGEPVGRLPTTYAIVPGALHVAGADPAAAAST